MPTLRARSFALPVAALLLTPLPALTAPPAAEAASTPFTCPAGDNMLQTGGLWTNVDNAGAFWQCDLSGHASLKHCPDVLQFNEDIRACDWPPSPTFPGTRLTAAGGTVAGSTVASGTSDLAVSLAAGPHGVDLLPGQITYRVTLTGTETAEPFGWARVSVRLPDGFTFASGSDENETTGCFEQSGTRAECFLDPSSGGTETETITVTPAVLALGPLTATATVDGEAPTADAESRLTASATCTAVTGLVVLC